MTKSVTITIANQKGGVGKTTMSINLATGFNELGYEVLLIDTDAQAHIGQLLKTEHIADRCYLYDWLMTSNDKPVPYEDGLNSLCLVWSDKRTVDLEGEFRSGDILTLTALGTEIKRYTKGRQVITIIDTAPTLGAVQLAALMAADWLIIPTIPEFASETGLSDLLNTVSEMKDQAPNLALLGIVPSLADTRTREHRKGIDLIKQRFPDLTLPTVRRRTAISEAARLGLPVWYYDETASEDYADLLNAICKRIGL